jgi:hypothetical protein
MFNSTFKRTAVAAAIALGLSGAAMAQDTSSAMRGSVLGPQGNGAPNTDIIIRHEPSGSTVEVTTDENGNFVANGLRVGGPYTVVLDSDVYRDSAYNEIYLQLGSTYRLNAQLEADEMERLQVTGSAVNLTSLNRGSSSSFGEEQIERTPTYGRDLKEVVRLNPLATQIGDGSELTVAGNNPKYNSITVDGIGQNDDFGLNSNGYPTQRSPISIDAIEQISVDVVPFSVKDSNFTGAKINAVTKSGTNEFEGSIFYQYTSDSLAGDPEPNRYEPGSTAPELDYEEKTKGFGLGGPIVKDKLFFYVNYEKTEEPQSVARGPRGSTASNIANVDSDVVDEIIRIAENVYQIPDVGNWNRNPVEEDEKILAKIDWNINNDHRLAVTYQSTEGEQTRNNDGSSGRLNLSSNWYSNTQDLKAYSGQLYSNWTSQLSTEIKVSKKEVDNGRNPLLGKGFGQARIETGEASVYLGADYSSQANELRNETTQFQFNAEYLTGNHLFQVGYDYTSVDVFNIFAEATLGAWEFDSVEDFENRMASSFEYKNHPSGNVNEVAANFTQGTHSIYVQDVWTPSWDFELTYGVRYEKIFADDSPRENERFEQRYGFSNTENLDGVDLILPRVGFKWNLTDDFLLRGGVGRYSGGRPNVWISNAYTNDGIGAVSFNPAAIDSSIYLENVDLTQVPQEATDSLVAGDGIVTPIDPNFDIPSEWRSSIGFDWTTDLGILGEDWFTSAEFIFSKKENDIAWTDLSRRTLLDENGEPVTTAAGRPIYVADDPLDNHEPNGIGDDDGISRYDLMLTNGKEGESKIFTFTLGKAWDNGISFNTSYTHQDVTEAFSGGSSTAWSNYRYTPTIDAENVQVNTAGYEVEHRFMANLTYTTQLFSGYDSSFSLFWERYSGRPYSYVLDTYGNSVFGDAGNLARSRYLPYIPTGANDPNVTYTDGLTYEALLPLLQESGLDKYAGGFAPMNEFRGPWNTTLDFNYTQELPGLMADHKVSLFFDVRNVLALFDKESAQQHYLFNGSPTTEFVKGDINPSTGQVVYGKPYSGYDASAPTSYLTERSTWQAKIGIRYSF